jgi:hypothetical protein
LIAANNFKPTSMQELIQKLMSQAGLTESQALAAIGIIKDFAKQKFPVFGGAIDKLFDKYSPRESADDPLE